MSRRLFFGKIAALMGIGITTQASHATTREKIELQRSSVAGFQYHQGETIWSSLSIGTALNLVRESDNPYDFRAVRVDWQGQKLGYVPRTDNATISHLLDAGHALNAKIVKLQNSKDPWSRIEFEIFLTV